MVEQVKTKTEPYVRFRGFDDEWEQVKFGDVLSYEQPTKYIVDSDNYDDSFITPVLTAGKSFLLGYTDETDGIYDKGDVILFDDFTTATQLVDFKFKVKSSAMKLLTPTGDNNINFLYEALNLVHYPHDDHKRYWISEYATLKVKTPSDLQEQQKIGDLFQTLDKAIDLSNTQVENLKQQKKALLQHLFPQKGETEPKVRLRGFTDEWEEVTLGDLVKDELIELSRGNVIPKGSNDGTYPVYSSSVTNNGLFTTIDDYMFDEELITWSIDGGGDFFYRPKHKFSVTNVSGVLRVLSEDVDIHFLYAQLSDLHTKKTFNYLMKAHPSVIKTLYTLYIPSLEEQQAIGELFQTLDEQIRLAEDKVSQYKELKQALLQRLFV